MEIQPFKNKTYYVVGLGRSGLSTLKALTHQGATVFAWDDTLAQRTHAKKAGFTVIHPEKLDWESLTALVLSPGIPHMLPKPHLVAHLAARYRTPIICDIDLFFKTLAGPTIVGVTGSNGKSTTTTLINHVLNHAGHTAAAGGNLGVPTFELPHLDAKGTYVVELSSYQLERITTPALSASVFLNITPNHLERHGDMARYQQAKLHIFDLLKPHGTKIIGVDNPLMEAIYQSLSDAYTIPISGQKQLQKGVYIDNGILIDHLATLPKEILKVTTLPHLKGAHNYQNIAACYAVCRAVHQLSPERIIKGLKTYEGLPHRQEHVAQHHNITYINDSKATSIDAASHALAAYKNIFWLVGGKPKTDSFDITPAHTSFGHIQRVYAFGEAAKNYDILFSKHLPTATFEGLEKALKQATEDALLEKENITILLAPACASFDQYKNFEERGDHFKKVVKKIIETLTKKRRKA
ncbi:MAG: UDP-N-acetylmuramoyl-L-alanine--D-glutamate ligase [Holosporaceae bacterium]|nr:MAG: UDP-N-acetylmuramoyl-L-alanine--D-glutamate ligase [Holosporaceae bacterium]